MRALFLHCQWPLFHCVLIWPFPQCLCTWEGGRERESELPGVSSYNTNPVESGPHPSDLINLNYFLRGSIFEYSHDKLGLDLGLGLWREFWRDTNVKYVISMNKQNIIIGTEGVYSTHSLNNKHEYPLCTRYCTKCGEYILKQVNGASTLMQLISWIGSGQLSR